MIHCDGKNTVITGTTAELLDEYMTITAEMIIEGLIEDSFASDICFGKSRCITSNEVVTVSKEVLYDTI